VVFNSRKDNTGARGKNRPGLWRDDRIILRYWYRTTSHCRMCLLKILHAMVVTRSRGSLRTYRQITLLRREFVLLIPWSREELSASLHELKINHCSSPRCVSASVAEWSSLVPPVWYVQVLQTTRRNLKSMLYPRSNLQAYLFCEGQSV